MVIYLDGAGLGTMRELAPKVQGFTTNPSLMKKAGVTYYRAFAEQVLEIATGKPVSFEVLADTLPEMARQAAIISSWGANVYTKIPITTTTGESTQPIWRDIKRPNITAVMTLPQIKLVIDTLSDRDSILSIFAGRIADTLADHIALVRFASRRARHTSVKVLWASTRELWNVGQAEYLGCHIITLGPDLVRKLDLRGKDLTEYSLETVRQFAEDAKGLTL